MGRSHKPEMEFTGLRQYLKRSHSYKSSLHLKDPGKHSFYSCVFSRFSALRSELCGAGGGDGSVCYVGEGDRLVPNGMKFYLVTYL